MFTTTISLSCIKKGDLMGSEFFASNTQSISFEYFMGRQTDQFCIWQGKKGPNWTLLPSKYNLYAYETLCIIIYNILGTWDEWICIFICKTVNIYIVQKKKCLLKGWTLARWKLSKSQTRKGHLKGHTISCNRERGQGWSTPAEKYIVVVTFLQILLYIC